MSHVEQGKYRGKHADGAIPDPPIAGAIRRAARQGRISCAACARIAGRTGVAMEEVGRNADLLEIKIDRCQLGLFGYGPSKGRHSILERPDSVPPALEKAIRRALEGDRLSCAAAWKLAEALGVSKKAVCETADALGIKTRRCQLGVF